MGTEYYIAVDVGATKTRIALCTRYSVVEKVIYKTPRAGDEYTIANLISSTARKIWSNFLGRVIRVGVATIGPLDISEGKVVNAPNNPIRNFELLKPLVRDLRKPVFVVNDCVAAAWGEKVFGDASSSENFVYLTLSTGIGAGAVVDGQLLTGKMGNAHEVGHIVVDFNSDLQCSCGGYGHWEAFAGGGNLPRVAKYTVSKEKVESELARKVSMGVEIDAETIFEYYRRGDALAKRVLDLYVKATAAGLASVINTYDPDLVILGGSVFLKNVDVLYHQITRLIELNVVTGMPSIKPTRFGDEVGLYGALAVAVNTPVRVLKMQMPLIESVLGKS